MKLTVILGTLKILKSLVTVPITTAVLPSRPCFFMLRAKRAKDIGGLLIFDMNNRLKTISLNLASVRLAKKRYSYGIKISNQTRINNAINKTQ